MQAKVIIVGLVLLISCELIVAKNESEKSENNNTNLEKQIFETEGGAIGISSSDGEGSKERKSRVKSRKGVSFEDLKIPINETTSDSAAQSSSSSATPPLSTSKNSSSSQSPPTVTVQKISSSSNSSENPIKLNSSNNSTTSIIKTSSSSSNKSTEKASVSPSTTTTTTTLKPSTTTTTTTTTTQQPIRKPTLTYSADDFEPIKDSEKNINYNVAKEKSPEDVLPKLEQDVDRTVLEEKRAQRSYMLYLGVGVVLPLTIYCGNLFYKRVKNYMELREYTRVDFLVDGMYVN